MLFGISMVIELAKTLADTQYEMSVEHGVLIVIVLIFATHFERKTDTP
jgi:hypothetical protein